MSPRRGGRFSVTIAFVVLAAAVAQAGVSGEIINRNGWPSFSRFWSSVVRPETSAEFLRLTLESTLITFAFAILGTTLALIIGAIGAWGLSELIQGRSRWWYLTRAVLVVPRAVHEILWALMLVLVFGVDPMVAVLAIGLPFGAVTAKVFAEVLDEADPGAYRTLRASGAGRFQALAYGVLPDVQGELLSYGFYRLECAIRSAAVLGVIGVGGLGFQLDLSFETLRYHEIWTLIAALMVLSGLADRWSSTIRRATAPAVRNVSLVVALLCMPLAWRRVGLDLSVLWSGRTLELGRRLAVELVPPRLGLGGWGELIDASIDTAAMSVIATAIAVSIGLVVGVLSARPVRTTARPSRAGLMARIVPRLVLLLARAVPSPIWAFLFVLILFPGTWPGAVALGVYNAGVLGRLFAEIFEERDVGPDDALALTGATSVQILTYGTIPSTASRLISVALYRWEVILRETVVVGVVGAGGLGRLIESHRAARDLQAITGAILALIVLSFIVDEISHRLRRSLTGTT